MQVTLGGTTIADSTDVRLLHPPGRTPTYLFPPSTTLVRIGFLIFGLVGAGELVYVGLWIAIPRPEILRHVGVR